MPNKPKRICRYPGCYEIVEGRYCDRHGRQVEREKQKRMDDQSVMVRKIRDSNRWARLSRRYLALHPVCEAPECGQPATEVHHVRPLREAPQLAFCMSNLMALCHACHARIERSSKGGGDS